MSMTHTRDGAAALARLRHALTDGSLSDAAQRHGLALVVLFGSAAEPTDNSPGDVDLAWDTGTTRNDLVGLTSDLLGLLGDAVHVMDLDRAGPVARQRALTRGEVLLQREAGAYATRQMRAMRDYADTAYLRRRQLALLAETGT
ncbi:nucleotidyltransferase family protein [Serinicoccus marinus]|uniref:nucleotidyltransferase family protein n=1 Tax=Serinicoccus marinus TaxID=247333 RepID=UPI0003B59A2C|nr:nucleotidyltransferase domain-containing protein [Serinicoccus marinus]